MVVLGVAAWCGGLLALLGPGWVPPALAAGALAGIGTAARRGRPTGLALACVVVGSAVAGCALVRAEANSTGPVSRLAEQRAVVTLEARVTSDPVTRTGRYDDFVVVRLSVSRVDGRGRTFSTRAPVVVLADETWADLELGSVVRARGRLDVPDDRGVAAVLAGSPGPVVVDPPAGPFGAAETVRAGIREAVSGTGPEARALVPALVVGDDRQMSPEVVADFRTCGLTHLAAVSGTNLTLVVGFLLLVARGIGARGRALTLVGIVGVAGFVLLARPEPSVVRAAAMGSVALVSLGTSGRTRGARALGVATVSLLLVDPWLVLSAGFALSVLATAGILFVAPSFRDRLRRWLPRWAAEAVAIPLAAQVACTPVVAALSGEVSLVAVAANIAVAPAVAPATVLGLVAGLVVLVAPPLGSLLGLGAGACGGWIVLVATQLAQLPVPAVDWSSRVVPIALLTGCCAAAAWCAGWVLARRRRTAVATLALALVVLRPLPEPGWPPEGWVLVACDVGQGDGLVLNAGGGRALVVDVGPEPEAIDTCLSRLRVEEVPMVVLTHFHADHVDGLAGVLDGRRVGEILTTPLRDPSYGAAAVDAQAARHQVRIRSPGLGDAGRVGAVSWRVLGPPEPPPDPGSEGSIANNASLVLLAEVAGVRVLLPGDVEPEAQAVLRRVVPGLTVDVLKVPHHGSRHQDTDWLLGLDAGVALVSVGEDNGYGHPSTDLVAALARDGALVRRTDLAGDVAVLVDDGDLRVRAGG
jgi:competence protein ComEC